MRLVTCGQIIADARLYANQRSDAFLSPTEWRRLVNQAATEFYDLLVESRGHEYFEKPATLVTTPDSAIVSLPADFYELITLIAHWGAQQDEELSSLDHLGDQVSFANWDQWAQYSPKAWRIRGALLEFFPTPTTPTELRLRYIPTCPEMTTDASTMDDVNGWSKMIAARAAMEALDLQAMPSTGAEKIYTRERERIEGLAAQRAAANPPTIRDVYGGADGRRWWNRLPWPVAGQ